MNRKKKKKLRQETPQLPDWERIRQLPVEMYNLASLGPVIGHREAKIKSTIRLWAPAMLRIAPPTNVIYMPVAFVETYFDLNMSFVAGTNPPPDIIVRGYRRYVEEFIKGAYNMTPVALQAEVPTDPHVGPAVDPDKEKLEKCPACQALVSNWQSHYPVEVPLTPRDNGGPPPMTWICEMTEPDIRAKFPNYEPRRPMDA